MQNQPPVQTLVRPPTCPDCRKPMRLRRSQTDQTLFECDCGRLSDEVAAFKRVELRWELLRPAPKGR
jgi:hypothetical protein